MTVIAFANSKGGVGKPTVCALTLAWLQTALDVDRSAWAKARAAIEGPASAVSNIIVR